MQAFQPAIPTPFRLQSQLGVEGRLTKVFIAAGLGVHDAAGAQMLAQHAARHPLNFESITQRPQRIAELEQKGLKSLVSPERLLRLRQLGQRLSERCRFRHMLGLSVVKQKRGELRVPLHNRCDVRLVCKLRMRLGLVMRGADKGEKSGESLERLLAEGTPHRVACPL